MNRNFNDLVGVVMSSDLKQRDKVGLTMFIRDLEAEQAKKEKGEVTESMGDFCEDCPNEG